MKILTILVLTMLLIFSVSMPVLSAEETGEIETSGYASVDIMSNYVWRGIKLSRNYVIQPSAGITYGGFGANLWSNIDPSWEGSSTEITETDVTLDYAFSIEKFSFDVGYIYYGLEAAEDTQELFASVGYDILLSPTLTIYYDFDVGDGFFLIASVGHSFDLPMEMALNLGASASYNIKNEVMGFDEDGDDFSGFYNGELSASVSIPVWKAISVEPKFAYSFTLSDDARQAMNGLIVGDNDRKDIFYGGLGVSLSF